MGLTQQEATKVLQQNLVPKKYYGLIIIFYFSFHRSLYICKQIYRGGLSLDIKKI